VIVNDANRAAVWPLVPQVAVVGVLASVVGRAIAPALRGAGEGIDRYITYTNLAGSFATYLFAFGGLFVLILELGVTFREKRLAIAYRVAAAVTSACVVALVVFAFRAPLPERASVLAALASSALALIASWEATLVRRTRALGITLAGMAVAALFHLSASLVAFYSGARGLLRLATTARVLAAASLLFDAAALLTVFLWLITRKKTATTWIARAALFLGCIVAWGALRGVRENAAFWQLLANRAVDRLIPSSPAALVWPAVRTLLETCAPMLGVAALAARGQMPAITGSLALALIARPSTDVPLSALALTLAALSAPLAARDDRGMWAVLMANSTHPQDSA
jgi:hypothetical protein